MIQTLDRAEATRLLFDWDFWAREKQREPESAWVIWLLLAGRGFGKSFTGAQWIRKRVESGQSRWINLVASTAADARDVMIEGVSGILECSPPWFRPIYEPSKRRLTWPNGAIATVFSAEEPDQLRGPQCDTFWADELAKWKYEDAWTQLLLGFRLGNPRGIVTTTPRPTKFVRDLVARNGRDVHVTRGTTWENQENLSPVFFEEILRQYEGTRIGRQELFAEVLDDNPGALWKHDLIDACRVAAPPALTRIVVAIDPAVTANATSDETGIVIAGVAANGHGYVLQDVSGIYTPAQWASRVIAQYKVWGADRIVAEVNNGGDLVEANLRTVDEAVSYKQVHASRGKAVRAEPIAALYEQGKVHHVGALCRLEDQMCDWDPTSGVRSPDRVDALVWALTELMLGGSPAPAAGIEQFSRESLVGGY